MKISRKRCKGDGFEDGERGHELRNVSDLWKLEMARTWNSFSASRKGGNHDNIYILVQGDSC